MKKLVVLLGMHRSGTSVTAHISQCMGAYLGEENELIGAYPSNLDGHFENSEVVNINTEILRFCGKEWYSLEAPELDWNHPQIRKAMEEIKAVIGKLLEKSGTAAVKDPRIPALLPLWDKVLKELEVEVHYIWIFRNPLEVMESLRKRDGYARKHGLLLWIHYNLRILKFLQGKNYLLIHYQDILENPCVLKELGRLFECNFGADRKRELEQIVKHGYCHSHYSYEDVWNTGNGLLAELYGVLLKNQEAKADAAKWEEQYRKAAIPEEALSVDDEVLENIRCLDKKEIVIYGAGNCGQRAAEILRKLGFANYNFCDKDIQKHGKKLMNGSIFSMEEIEERKNLVVITAIEEKWARKEAEYTLAYIPGIRFLSFSVLEALGKGADGT